VLLQSRICLSTDKLPLTGCYAHGLRLHDVRLELITLVNRHLVKRPIPVDAAVIAMRGFFHSHPPPQLLIMSAGGVLAGRSGLRGRRYMRGFQQLFTRGLRRSDAKVSMMLKLELSPIDKLRSKEDRAIQYRSVVYNAALSKFLVPFEHWFLRQSFGNRGFPCVMKGINNLAMGHIIYDAWQSFTQPMALLLDHSRFDSCVSIQHLRLEHAYYLAAFRGNRRLAWLLQQQLRNFGVSRGGIVYRTVGKRMSGDVNTSLGNTLINLAVMRSVLGDDGVLFVNGDDSVFICERRPFDDGQLISLFVDYGFNTEVLYAWRLSDIDFCQTKMCVLSTGPQLLPNPFKVLDKICLSARRVPLALRPGLLKMKCLSELWQSYHCPVLAPLLWRIASSIPDRPRFESDEEMRVMRTLLIHDSCEEPFDDPSDCAIYCVSFGVDADVLRSWFWPSVFKECETLRNFIPRVKEFIPTDKDFIDPDSHLPNLYLSDIRWKPRDRFSNEVAFKWDFNVDCY